MKCSDLRQAVHLGGNKNLNRKGDLDEERARLGYSDFRYSQRIGVTRKKAFVLALRGFVWSFGVLLYRYRDTLIDKRIHT